MGTDIVFLDTETTGLYPPRDKIVEIAIIDGNGKILINSLVNPEREIPLEVINIHGIDNEMVKNSPTLKDLEPELFEILNGKNLIVYNLNFDIKFLPRYIVNSIKERDCCMLRFAEAYGEWNEYYGNFKWKSLSTAANHVGYKWEGVAHRALADTLACRAVWDYLEEKLAKN
jgi:DNA polymerase III epsilon subunit family exonuclease